MPYLVSVYGPTASGKSNLAEYLADELDAILVNADAFQVYKHFDIGTNKSDLKDRYHLISHVEPTTQYGLGEWIKDITTVLAEAWDKKRNVVVVGGTGLYLRALNEEWTEIHPPAPADLKNKLMEQFLSYGIEYLQNQLIKNNSKLNQSDYRNPKRILRALEKQMMNSKPTKVNIPPFHKVRLAPTFNWEELRENIILRTPQMINSGWIKECEKIIEMQIPRTAPAFQAIGYNEICNYIEGKCSLKDTTDIIAQKTIWYARKQKTWLRTEKLLSEVNFSELMTLKNKYLCEYFDAQIHSRSERSLI